MLCIHHRINTIEALAAVPPAMGVELDIRSEGDHLILQHDPFQPGERFEDYLRQYRHAFMILNIKAEGLEAPALELLRKYKVEHYFFLDLSFPALIQMIRKGERRLAVRFSEFEPLEACLALKGKAEWVWVDCFKTMPLDAKNYAALKKDFKLCLVSPELQHHPKEKIAEFKTQMTAFKLDAVCTKFPELWQNA